MRLLLDTHAFVWSTTRPAELSPAVMAILLDPQSEIFVSAVSAYEIEYKRDRDPLLQLMPSELDEAVQAQGMAWLPVSERHAASAARLAPHHRDPWDRILVAQALLEELHLGTIDGKLSAYGVPTVW
jgi:PIN domain nuclease of toxin-antitoxin system